MAVDLIFLTGMAGAGKSTVGVALARNLGWSFADLDAEIVSRAGQSIPEIFAQGEPHFRDLESDVLSVTVRAGQTVIALGGGTLEREANFELVQATGVLVYLRASLDVLVERDWQSNRHPLLSGMRTKENLRRRIAELVARRASRWQAAPIIVDVDASLSPEMIASNILALLSRHERV